MSPLWLLYSWEGGMSSHIQPIIALTSAMAAILVYTTRSTSLNRPSYTTLKCFYSSLDCCQGLKQPAIYMQNCIRIEIGGASLPNETGSTLDHCNRTLELIMSQAQCTFLGNCGCDSCVAARKLDRGWCLSIRSLGRGESAYNQWLLFVSMLTMFKWNC